MMAQEVSRREAGVKLIETPLNIGLRLDRLMAFIGHYQDNHQGETPTVEVMANEMSTTKQTIRYWLGILENQGRVRRISQNPLRLMLKEGVKPIEAARKFDDIARGVTSGGWKEQIAEIQKEQRFQGAEARRFKLARFIGEFWEKHGFAPSLIQMMDAMNTTAGATVSFMLDALEHRGVIYRPNKTRQYEVRLTPNGMSAFGMKEKKEAQVTETAKPTPSVGFTEITAERAKAADEKAHEIHDWMAEYQRRHKTLPTIPRIAQEFGYAEKTGAKGMLQRMERMGLFKFGPRGYRDGQLLGVDLPKPEPRRLPKQPGKTRPVVIWDHFFQAQRCAQAMLDYWRKVQGWPQITDLAGLMGYKSPTGPRRALTWMEERGFARRVKEDSRYSPWMLTEKGRNALLDEEKPPLAKMVEEDERIEQDHPGWMTGETEEDMETIRRLEAENAELKRRLAEALTATRPAQEPQKLSEADMVLALIDAGFDVRRR